MSESTTTTSTTTTRRRKSTSKPKKPVPITRKATFVGGRDLAPNVTETKMLGSVNPVTRTQLNSSTQIKGGPTIYFKPVKNTAQYAVASTRLARVLGMEDVISHNAFAHMNGQDGVVSGQVLGVPVRALEYDKETQIPDEYNSNKGGQPKPEDIQNWLDSVGSFVVQKDGKYFELTSYVFNPVNYKDPRIQKGMSDLQIFDAISGQVDRHGGNIYVDPQTGKVTGIDDDLSMRDSGFRVDETHGKYPGLPPLVDLKTAQKILALRPEKLPLYLGHRENDLKDLSPEEMRAAEKRLNDVQTHLKTLQGTGGIVDTWNDGTYDKLMENPGKTYLGLAETDLEDALAGKLMAGYPAKVAPPLVPSPPLPVTTITVTSAQPQPTVQPSPPLSTRPTGASPWGAIRPSSPSAHAATSRLASARPRPRVVEKEKETLPQPLVVDDFSKSSSEADTTTTTTTEADDPTQGGAPIVSPPRPVEPTDINARLDVLEALLRDLTG